MLVHTKSTRPAVDALFLYCDRGGPLFSGRGQRRGGEGALSHAQQLAPKICTPYGAGIPLELSFELAILALLDVVLVAALAVPMGVDLPRLPLSRHSSCHLRVPDLPLPC